MSLAETLAEQARAWDLQQQPGRAEQFYLRALEIFDRLYQLTGDRDLARKAADLCLDLADLSMQQGNMHGADVYYVKAMTYGKDEKNSTER